MMMPESWRNPSEVLDLDHAGLRIRIASASRALASNPEFDATLEKALAIPDPKARMVVMKDLEKILQDSGIIIQPYG